MAETLSSQTRFVFITKPNRWLAVRVGATAIAGAAVGAIFDLSGGSIGFVEGTVLIALILWLCYWPQLVAALPGGASWWNRISTLISCVSMGYAFSTLLKFRYQSHVGISIIPLYQIVIPIAVGLFIWIFWWAIIESRKFYFCIKFTIIPSFGLFLAYINEIITGNKFIDKDEIAALLILLCASLIVTIAIKQSTAQNKARVIIFDLSMFFAAYFFLCFITMATPENTDPLGVVMIQSFLVLIITGCTISNLLIIVKFVFSHTMRIFFNKKKGSTPERNQPIDVIFSLSTSVLINMTIVGIPLCLLPYLKYMRRSAVRNLKAPRRLAFMAAAIYAAMYIYYDFIVSQPHAWDKPFGMPIDFPSALAWGCCSAIAAWVIGSNLKDSSHDLG